MTISIDISPGEVSVTGSVRHVITDAEVQTFGLNDNALKNAVLANFGRRPNDAFLKSPTPWGDLYKSYGWEEVQTVLVVSSSRITEETSRPVMVDYKDFINNSGREAEFTASMSRDKTNSASHTWSNTHSIGFSQSLEYKISFGISAGGESTMSYEHSFGQSGTEEKSTTLSSGAGVMVVVGPNSVKHAILSATEGHMRVRIVYQAYLRGRNAVNYNPRYNGHHFYALDIANVMNSGNISNSRSITEDIVLQSYSRAQVILGSGPAPKGAKASIASSEEAILGSGPAPTEAKASIASSEEAILGSGPAPTEAKGLIASSEE